MDENNNFENNNSGEEVKNNGNGKKGYLSIVIWIVVFVIIIAGVYIVYNNYAPENDQASSANTTSSANKADSGDNSDDYSLEVPDFSLKNLDGNEINLSDYKGKIVVLNFWATWCGFCVDEMPDFNKLNNEFNKEGNKVILAVNVEEGKNKVKKFLQKNEFDLNVVLDIDGEVAREYDINGYPTTIFINKNGSFHKQIIRMTSREEVLDIVNNME